MQVQKESGLLFRGPSCIMKYFIKKNNCMLCRISVMQFVLQQQNYGNVT
jgi:hypothetical protein